MGVINNAEPNFSFQRKSTLKSKLTKNSASRSRYDPQEQDDKIVLSDEADDKSNPLINQNVKLPRIGGPS